MSLDNTVSNYVNSPVTWADLLPCHHSIALQQQQEEKEQLEGAISMLDDKPRMAVELVFVKQLTRKDAAKKIGATPITVTRYLQQGLQQLITYLQPTTIATGS